LVIRNIKYNTDLRQYVKLLNKYVETPIYPDPEQLSLPDPEELQIVKKPLQTNFKFNNNFSILTKTVEDNDEVKYTNQTRWIIEPNSELEIFVNFKSSELGVFKQNLNLYVESTFEKYILELSSECDIPKIN
jgi:hypothetical protein